MLGLVNGINGQIKTIIKAAKRVGIFETELNWKWTEVEKVSATEPLVEADTIEPSSWSKSSWRADEHTNVRYSSMEYYKILNRRQLD